MEIAKNWCVLQYNQKSGNPIKTVGRDSFFEPKTPKNTTFLGVAQPLYSRGHN